MTTVKKPAARKGKAAKVEEPPREPRAEKLGQVEAEELAAKVLAGSGAEEKAPLPDVLVDPQKHGDVYRVMDALDEAQILAELEGKPSDVMVYVFNQGGQRVVGLSWAGVAECARAMNAHRAAGIRSAKDVPPLVREVTETDEKGETVTYIETTVYVEDVVNGGGNWGTARQPKFQTFRDKDRTPELDKFASTKSLSKAQRNAMSPLVPASVREALIALAIGNEKRVKEIRVGMGDPTVDMPPPLVDARATELKKEIRGIYDEIRKGWVKELPPGRFNAKLRRAEVEHESLEELRDELRSQLDHLKAAAS